MSDDLKKFSDELRDDPTKRAAIIADVRETLKKHGVDDEAFNVLKDKLDDPNGVVVYRDGQYTSTWIVS